jgi:DsbC/DsbD-like thiol-disulfide interchange protein
MKQFWVLLGLFFLCFPVDAQAVRSAHTTVQLVTENTSIQPGQTFWVGLRMQMDPQWHTYWRNPGDAGLPTTIKWQLPTGFSAGAIQWPHPEYIATPPLGSYGYEGETLLLTQLTAPATLKPGTTVTLQAKVTWLECRDVCLPGKANLSLSLPVAKQSQVSPARSALFTTTRSQLPLATSDWQIQVANAGQELILQGMLNDAPTLEKIHFFPYQDLLIEPAAPQVLTQTKAGFRLALKKLEGNAPPERLQGVLVAEQGWRGANSEQALLVDIPLSAATDNGGLTLGAALGLAFLGGLILNLMPCGFCTTGWRRSH